MTALLAPETGTPEPPTRAPRRWRYLLGVAAGVGLTAVAVPGLTGASWAAVATAAGQVPIPWLAALLVLWLVGLLAHTITLTAAMPGLTHRRALTLSLTGSAVANVLPLGGAAGIALNYRMSRAWGHGGPEFSAYTVVTNVWDVLAKLLIPVLALPALLVAASSIGPTIAPAAAIAAGVLAVLTAVALATIASPRAAERTGSAVDRLLGRWLRPRSCRAALVRLQAEASQVVRTQWPRLSLGMALYSALLFALLLGCLTAAGAALPLGAVAAGFAVERLLTLAGLTPGGAGVVEVGLIAVLAAFPGSSVGVALGVVLYRALTFVIEIPVGGTILAGWLWTQRGRATGAVV
ncbi:lysylphosphatidylglycerol synthase domain-containing protein [Nocardioides mangrovi]|uniref:Flippase-like domain-containing protein n=1 Tax=Nocardioides mangrovi TaxID=2874580 RepID=A0ABS7U942_9ACTN|nr:lysylphosphatidylglycerol synthase domain-containing protein [Nocardioides mangrovi]MBZ5737172.1 flippase-like domain-containing protein [Nocardioides mangrovi]